MRRKLRVSRLVPAFIRRSFRTKLFLAVMVPVSLAAVDTSQYIGRLWWRVELIEVQSLMFATVVQMAHALDAEELERLTQSEAPAQEPGFDQIRSQLLSMRRVIVDAVDFGEDEATADKTVIDLYVLAPTDDPGIGRFIVTSNVEEAGRLYDMSRFPKLMEGWERATVEDRPYKDEYATSLSAYAPVFNNEGVVVAVVGMDADARYFTLITIFVIALATIMLIGVMLFSVLCAWWLARVMTRSLKMLATGMQHVSAGDLDTAIEPLGSGDEFDRIFLDFNHMVAGLRNRQEIERQLADAGAIQTGMLPSKAPAITGYDIAGGIRYCEQAGGDYYDYLRITSPDGNERCGIAIGDVTGHGITSALTMCSCRAALRSAATRCGDDIASMLSEVNRALADDSPGGAFMTMFMGILDPEQGELRWSSAGHDPGLLIRAGSDQTDHLASTDIPLGIDPSRSFDEGKPVTLGQGDVLVIGTDGVSQARDASGGFFGFDRIAKVVRQMPGETAKEIRDRILSESHAFAGGGQLEDDATLVVLSRS